MLNPDFELLIKKDDILIFVETKTDEFDHLDLPDEYTFFAKHRKKVNRKSGGIIIIFKKYLSKYINFLQSESEYVQWVEISKRSYKHNNQNDQILIGCIYIPPDLSPSERWHRSTNRNIHERRQPQNTVLKTIACFVSSISAESRKKRTH